MTDPVVERAIAGADAVHAAAKEREHTRRRSADDLEYVDGQLDRLISDRARAAQAEKEREEVWRASVRRHNARRELEMRLAWRDHYLSLAATHEQLAEANKAKAINLMGMGLPKTQGVT